VRHRILDIKIERNETESEGRESNGVALRDRSSPMVHEFLANMEVLVEMAPWSELGERSKVVGHCIFPFESRVSVAGSMPNLKAERHRSDRILHP
jgi:hypothetical protein